MSYVTKFPRMITIHGSFGFHLNPGNAKLGFLCHHNDPCDCFGHMSEAVTDDVLDWCDGYDRDYIVEGRVRPEGYLILHATSVEALDAFVEEWEIAEPFIDGPTAT